MFNVITRYIAGGLYVDHRLCCSNIDRVIQMFPPEKICQPSNRASPNGSCAIVVWFVIDPIIDYIERFREVTPQLVNLGYCWWLTIHLQYLFLVLIHQLVSTIGSIFLSKIHELVEPCLVIGPPRAHRQWRMVAFVEDAASCLPWDCWVDWTSYHLLTWTQAAGYLGGPWLDTPLSTTCHHSWVDVNNSEPQLFIYSLYYQQWPFSLGATKETTHDLWVRQRKHVEPSTEDLGPVDHKQLQRCCHGPVVSRKLVFIPYPSYAWQPAIPSAELFATWSGKVTGTVREDQDDGISSCPCLYVDQTIKTVGHRATVVGGNQCATVKLW